MKRIPSLTSNFAGLISENACYVDKTHFIPILEKLNFKYLFFLRPRRFGKSLLLSMLEHYYGIQHKEQFDHLFGEYFIGNGENTTSLKNSYHILHLDFSGITTEQPEGIKKSFNSKVLKGFKEFYDNYNDFDRSHLSDIDLDTEPADFLLTILSDIQSNSVKRPIYLFIDEYDHFTNELFAFNTVHFKEIVSRNGWVRKFYEVIKQFMGSGLIDRFFATGVTPVTLDSMTSGFNVAKNITFSEEFHEMAGFSENELEGLIRATIYEDGKFDLESVIDEMRAWYNGSRFSPDTNTKIYNPQMVISFLSDFSLKYRFPREMVDVNVTSDYKKISNILKPLSDDDSNLIVDEVLSNGIISEGLTIQYNFERNYTKTDAVSLLFYNGLLTIDSVVLDRYNYVIPNYVMQQLYWEFFRVLKEDENNFSFDTLQMKSIIEELALEGKVDKLVGYAQKVMKVISFRDLQNFSEKNLKMIFMTLLAGTNAFFVKSESETGAGYVDIYIKRTKTNPGEHDHLIELKYIKVSDKKTLDKIKSEGIAQVQKYRNSLPDEELKSLHTWLIIIYDKFEAVFIEVK